jgi:hypothetical protein
MSRNVIARVEWTMHCLETSMQGSFASDPACFELEVEVDGPEALGEGLAREMTLKFPEGIVGSKTDGEGGISGGTKVSEVWSCSSMKRSVSAASLMVPLVKPASKAANVERNASGSTAHPSS